MSERPEQPTVEWMPGVAVGVLTLVLTQFVWIAGTAVAVLALATLVVLLVRGERRPLTWVCLGSVLGAAVWWAVIAANGGL